MQQDTITIMQDNMRNARLRAGMTQKQLAKASGIHINTVERMEYRYGYNIQMRMAVAAANALNIPLKEYLFGVEE